MSSQTHTHSDPIRNIRGQIGSITIDTGFIQLSDDEALQRRLIVIPFEAVVGEKERIA